MSERLEEIKSRVWKEKCTYAKGDDEIREGYSYTLSDYDFEWLIQQAERVEKLQLEVNDWRDEAIKWNKRFEESEESHLETLELLKSILNQNKCYREALESIRDMFPLRGGITYEKLSKIRKIAEEALEDDKNDR